MSQSTEEKVYLQWMNSHLKDEGISLQNLQSDIQTAIPVLRVLEILSGRPSPSHAKSHLTPIQINDNWHVVLQFMRKLRIPCDSLDADGKHKQLSKLLSTDKS
jgi:fructose-bisphosphate aldolase class 1